MKLKKIIAILSVVIVSGLMIYGYMLYREIFAPNTKFQEKQVYLYIPTNANYDEVKQIITPFVKEDRKSVV